MSAQAKLIKTFTDSEKMQATPLADATPDGKFVVLGCGQYFMSKKTLDKICNPGEGQIEIYNVEKDTYTPVTIKYMPQAEQEFVAAYDIYGQSLFLADFSEAFYKPDALSPQTIRRIDLSTGKSEDLLSLPESHVCTQIRALSTGLLCSLAKYTKEDDGRVYFSDVHLVVFEYFTNKLLLNEQISNALAMPSLGLLDIKGPSVIVSEDLGGGLYATQKSFLFDPTNLNFQFLNVFPFPQYGWINHAGQQLKNGENLFYFHEFDYRDSAKPKNKLVIVSDKSEPKVFDIPLNTDKMVDVLGVSESSGNILYASPESYDKLSARTVYRWSTTTDTVDELVTYDHAYHLLWSQKMNQLIVVSCREKLNNKYDCGIETLNPDTGAKTHIDLPPNAVPESVTFDKDYNNLQIVINGNSYLYNVLEGKNRLLIDRFALPAYGVVRGTRQVSDTKVLGWFGIYDENDDQIGAEVHLLEIDDAN